MVAASLIEDSWGILMDLVGMAELLGRLIVNSEAFMAVIMAILMSYEET